MKLPPDAIIAREKLSEYLLVPRPEDDKSAWLARAGYGLLNAEQLEQDLRRQVLALPAVFTKQNKFGKTT